MAMWPTDDTQAESYETLKANYKRLSPALKEVRHHSENEIEYEVVLQTPLWLNSVTERSMMLLNESAW